MLRSKPISQNYEGRKHGLSWSQHIGKAHHQEKFSDIKTNGQRDLGNLAKTNFYQVGHQCTRLVPCPNLDLIVNLSWEISAWLCAKERGAPVISHQAAPSLRFDSTTDGSAPIVCSNPCESRVMCLNGITGVWTRIFTEVLFTVFKIWKHGYPLMDIFLNKL